MISDNCTGLSNVYFGFFRFGPESYIQVAFQEGCNVKYFGLHITFGELHVNVFWHALSLTIFLGLSAASSHRPTRVTEGQLGSQMADHNQDT